MNFTVKPESAKLFRSWRTDEGERRRMSLIVMNAGGIGEVLDCGIGIT
jgi:hypothetical protein